MPGTGSLNGVLEPLYNYMCIVNMVGRNAVMTKCECASTAVKTRPKRSQNRIQIQSYLLLNEANVLSKCKCIIPCI